MASGVLGHQHPTECPLTADHLLHVLHGVIQATKAAEDKRKLVEDILVRTAATAPHDLERASSAVIHREPSETTFLVAWHSLITSTGLHQWDTEVAQIVGLTVAVTCLRQLSRDGHTANSTDIALIWDLVAFALTHYPDTRGLGSVSRSAQGFLAVPLCSILQNGNIDELFRLHVWLPDGKRGNPDCPVHSHQPFAQSWILAGKGTDHSYEVKPAEEPSLATHARFSLAWSDGKTTDKSYKTFQTHSTITNTGELVRATWKRAAVHVRGSTYSIPAGAFHTSEVDPGRIHATLFFFDAHRGFEKDAGIIGPPNVESFTQKRESADVTAERLKRVVSALRTYEEAIQQGQRHVERAEVEDALKSFNYALNTIDSLTEISVPQHYRQNVLGEFGKVQRRFGRYEQAKKCLENALENSTPSLQSVDLYGELSVVYRHMDLLEHAKRASESQYDMAEKLDYEPGKCQALGTMGTISYQLSQERNDPHLLKVAIEQLQNRVRSARKIQEAATLPNENLNEGRRASKTALVRESIGLARLSLCYTALGDMAEAKSKALESLEIALTSGDSNVAGWSRFYYGRALLHDGNLPAALEQFNSPGGCPGAIPLCKEPSVEHREYLQEFIKAGGNLDLVDDKGYTALDHAVFSNDEKTETMVMEGLRVQHSTGSDQELMQRYTQAKVRRGYRELFQDKLRPVLLRGGQEYFHNMRHTYAVALQDDEKKRQEFDSLNFVWYADFRQFGTIPRSSDNLTHQFNANESHMPKLMVFFSYRWMGAAGTHSPDDAHGTQYRRMIKAIEKLLEIHCHANAESLGIWIDHACIDQAAPTAGTNSLPLSLAQCNAMISLVDDEYYSRAWCSVEVMMMQTLRDSYGLHYWYEYLVTDPQEYLRPATSLMNIRTDTKKLTFEKADRPKVMFLERQCGLLAYSNRA